MNSHSSLTSRKGSDWMTVYVRPTDAPFRKAADGTIPSHLDGQLPDKLEGIKFTALTWTHDSKGFFYQVRALY